MKIHIFYKKRPVSKECNINQSFNLINEPMYDIYAYTENKDVANEFIKERNMEKYAYRIVNFNKKEFHKFDKQYCEYKLCLLKLKNSIDSYIEVLGTEIEFDVVLNFIDKGDILRIINNSISKLANLPLKQKIIDSLLYINHNLEKSECLLYNEFEIFISIFKRDFNVEGLYGNR